MTRGPYVYRVQYVSAGRSNTTTVRSELPLEAGQWITVDGVFLVVERIVMAKRGDGLALCKPAVG
jgi:hypothetical protein